MLRVTNSQSTDAFTLETVTSAGETTSESTISLTTTTDPGTSSVSTTHAVISTDSGDDVTSEGGEDDGLGEFS